MASPSTTVQTCWWLQCDFTYTTEEEKSQHLEMHFKESIHSDGWRCLKCNESFTMKLALRRHNAAVHLGIKRHPCNKCEQSFRDAIGYKNHYRTAHGIVIPEYRSNVRKVGDSKEEMGGKRRAGEEEPESFV
ncbi:uncharacterized protein LY89DRAFT_676464 [Mollisia scopiformis]|uniref:C2H2-type domain-containing protein n=1 Tax=Mollisia scopiformis TaxID=149040 RepID=A0A132B9M0_MOLSC|nr:uncharacterized protein LY89DRAFT_676464 [Mollisia scopiformis]KUJ09095.1 hypothetical protein LY89DRAFT_676464 [Mollisia scopiformis]